MAREAERECLLTSRDIGGEKNLAPGGDRGRVFCALEVV
jgi:hypothetical protein